MAKFIVKVDPEIKEIIPEFLERRRNDVLKLREFLNSREFHNLQMMGHRLKSNSAGYGCFHLGTLGGRLENAALAESIEKAISAVDEIEDFLTNVQLED